MKTDTKRRRRPSRHAEIRKGSMLILAERGARGLTHRAVDEVLSLPEGSTSYYFKTRSALIEAASEALFEQDLEDLTAFTAADGTVNVEGLFAHWSAPEMRTAILARFELFLEAARNPELQVVMQRRRQAFVNALIEALRHHGVEKAEMAVYDVIASFEGRLLQQIAFGDLPSVEGDNIK